MYYFTLIWITLLFIGGSVFNIVFGQMPYAPLKPNTKNYYHDGSPKQRILSLWIDSVATQNGILVHEFNKVVKPCIDCGYVNCSSDYCLSHPEECYARKRQSQFLKQRAHLLADNTIILQEDANTACTLLPLSPLNQSWVFDSLNEITAQIIAKGYQTIFEGGPWDSTLTIRTSINDTVILSKNFGVVQWRKYKLVGFDGQDGRDGKWVPAFKDIYNFSVGDMFERKKTYDTFIGGGYAENYVNIKYTVENKFVSGDTFTYHFKGLKYRHNNYNNQTSWQLYDEVVTYIDSAKHKLNYHANELFRETGWSMDGHPYCDTISVGYHTEHERVLKWITILDLSVLVDNFPDSIPLVSSIYGYDCNFINCALNCVNPTYGAYIGAVYEQFQGGIGPCAVDELVAYSTIYGGAKGVFTSDSTITSSTKLPDEPKLKVYPNPVQNYLRIETGSIGTGAVIIYDVTGKVVLQQKLSGNTLTLSVEDLEPAVYLLKVNSNHQTHFTKFIKF